jgi:hypothetical protein
MVRPSDTSVSIQSDDNSTESATRELLIVEDEAVTALDLREHLQRLRYRDGETVRQVKAIRAYGFVSKPIRARDLDKITISRHNKQLELREAERRELKGVSRHANNQLEQFTYAAGSYTKNWTGLEP